MSSDGEPFATPSSSEKTASSTYQLPESEVHFAFGPGDYYYIRCGTASRFVRRDNGDWSWYGIESPYWAAFKHDTGLLIGGIDEDGESQVTHSWIEGYLIKAKDVDSYVEAKSNYSKLKTWIDDHVESDPEKVKSVAISIGPKGSYFARSGSSHIAHKLPKDLEKAMKESNSPASIVALGARGAWVVLWADGTRSWNLRDAYPGLATSGNWIDDSNKVVFIALNPFNENNHFMVKENGQISYNTNFSDANHSETEALHKMTHAYMYSRAKRDGTTFSGRMWMNGVTKDYEITPQSDGQESRGEALVAMLRGRQNILRHSDLAFCGALGGGMGIVARLGGVPTTRAVGMAAAVSFGAGLSMWKRGT